MHVQRPGILTESFEQWPARRMRQRQRLTKLALIVVWIGAAAAFAAAVSKLFTEGSIEQTTIVFAILAIANSIPVYRDYRRITAALAQLL